MAGTSIRRQERDGVQDAALRLLLEEARLLALNAAIESAAVREAGLPGDEDAATAAQGCALAVDRLLQQIRSAPTLPGQP